MGTGVREEFTLLNEAAKVGHITIQSKYQGGEKDEEDMDTSK